MTLQSFSSVNPIDSRGMNHEPGSTPEVRDEPDQTVAAEFSGVHSVLKSVDYWFEREVHDIEREADQLAGSWAQENLPTLNGSSEDELPPETMLAKRSGQLWKTWPERIKVKMQDAIDSAGAELGGHVAGARAALTELRVTRTQLRETEGKIEEIRREMSSRQGPVRYHRYFGKSFALLMSLMLIAVEFIANQPVFRILWPMQQSVAARMSETLEAAASSGWSSGIRIALLEIVSYVEASLLALAVVILLFVLAKTVGGAIRPIVALKVTDYPFASRTIQSLHRQKRLMIAIAGIGSLAVLVFLFMSRGSAPMIVGKRAQEAKGKVEMLQKRIDSTTARGEMLAGTIVIEKTIAEEEVRRLENDLQFASNIAANNGGILILNVSLVCFAIVVGFMADERDLTDTMGDHPDLPRLKDKCIALEEAQLRCASDAREHIRLGEVAVSRIVSLLRSQPLATLEAKRQRLESIIPRWRTHNAQLRGLDPASISAFRRPISVSLPEISTLVQLARPESVDQMLAELRELANAVYSVEKALDLKLADAA